MTDEEKKALERIDYIQDFIIENGQYNADVNDMEYFSWIKNLIEKQSKEIEELTLDLEEMTDFYNPESLKRNYWLYKSILNSYISKDKIKAKIEEVDIQLQELKDGLTGRKTNFVNKNMLFAQKKVLQSLLDF